MKVFSSVIREQADACSEHPFSGLNSLVVSSLLLEQNHITYLISVPTDKLEAKEE